MATGAGDLGPAKAESPALFFLSLFRCLLPHLLCYIENIRQDFFRCTLSSVFLLIMLHSKIFFKAYCTLFLAIMSRKILDTLRPGSILKLNTAMHRDVLRRIGATILVLW